MESVFEFFLYTNRALEKSERGKVIPGTLLPIRPYQIDAVQAFLHQLFVNSYTSHILALGTGTSKTIITYAILTVMRLIELNYYLVRIDRNNAGNTHNPLNANPYTPYPPENLRGILCCCVKGSLSVHIARSIEASAGPSIAFTPPGVL